jgi:hypothetical protein
VVILESLWHERRIVLLKRLHICGVLVGPLTIVDATELLLLKLSSFVD